MEKQNLSWECYLNWTFQWLSVCYHVKHNSVFCSKWLELNWVLDPAEYVMFLYAKNFCQYAQFFGLCAALLLYETLLFTSDRLFELSYNYP